MRQRSKISRRPHCSKCGRIKERPSQGYCNYCHAEFMRKTRPKHRDLPDHQRIKANARGYLNEYIRRGSVHKQPCIICGNVKVEAHHTDYSKPLQVEWYCRKHHLELHEKLKTA